MLPCQRALFDIPRDVCFLNAAAWSPLPLAVQEVGRAATKAVRASRQETVSRSRIGNCQ